MPVDRKFKVQKYQTIFDVALVVYGSAFSYTRLIKLNPGLNANSNLFPGQTLIIDEASDDDAVKRYFEKNNETPATGEAMTGGFNDGFSNGFNI